MRIVNNRQVTVRLFPVHISNITPIKHSHAQPRSIPNLVNYFLQNVSMSNIRMLFCHIQVAPFAHEKIGYMGIYFPRNFITTAEHVVVVEAVKYLIIISLFQEANIFGVLTYGPRLQK